MKYCKIIDTIDNVGRCCLINETVSYSEDLSGPTVNCEQFSGSKFFSAVGRFSNLYLDIFKDIEYPIYKGGFEINFLRHTDDYALFRDNNDKSESLSVGKIIIDEFNISIPYGVYGDMNKIKLINDLTLLS